MITTLLTTAAAGIAKATGITVRPAERVDDSGLVKTLGTQQIAGIDDRIAPAFDLIATGQLRGLLEDDASCGRGQANVSLAVQLLYYGKNDVSSVVLSALSALGQTFTSTSPRVVVQATNDIKVVYNYAEVWGLLSRQTLAGGRKNPNSLLTEEPIYVPDLHLILFTFELKARYPLSNCTPLCR